MRIGLDKVEKHELVLNKLAIKDALEIDGINIIGVRGHESRSGILSFNMDEIHPHDVCMVLDSENIMVRSGAHCAHSWFNYHKIQGSVRASFYLYNTKEEVEKFIEVLKKVKKNI